MNSLKKKNAQRADGRYAVQVYIGQKDGKRKYKTVYGRTQKEADDKARELKVSLQKGIDIAAEYDTFNKWADAWLKIKSTEVSHSQMNVYSSCADHLNRYLADAPITKIKTLDIQKIITDLAKQNPNTGKPASKKLLNATKQTAGQVFRLAIDNRILDYNPADSVKIPKSDTIQTARALTEEEQRWINEFEHPAQTAAMIMMYAGLRRGELIPLTWNDIDLENKTISINKTVERISNKYIVKNTAKNETSIRVVDMPIKLVNYLKNLKKTSIFVCPNAKGQLHTFSSFRSLWRSYIKDLNLRYGNFEMLQQAKSKFDPNGTPLVIPKINPHWLRHTYCTLLYFSGVDLLTAKEQTGHKDINTLLEIYTHLDRKYKRKSMNKMDEYLASSGS